MNLKYVFAIGFLLVSIAGCGQDNEKKSQLALMKTTNPSPMLLQKNTNEKLDLVKSIEKDIESMKALYDVVIVKGKKHTLVAYKVKHMHRFKMKKIEKDMKNMLEHKYPKEKFVVSSDYKIFLEAVRLKEKMDDPNYTKEEANKRLNKIIRLKKELT